MTLGPARRVRRTGGILVPGFTKRFDERGTKGVTYWLGVPIGRFDVVEPGPTEVELRYRRWPIIDVLERGRHGTGLVRLPGARRIRFCRFDLEP